MIIFIAGFLKAYLSSGLIAGALFALWRPVFGRNTTAYIGCALASGPLIGGPLYYLAFSRTMLVEFQTVLSALGVTLAILSSGVVFFGTDERPRSAGRIRFALSLFFIAVVCTLGTFSIANFVYDQALTATTVLNTELIVNMGAIIIGAGLITFLAPLTGHIHLTLGRSIALTFFLILCIFPVLDGAAEAMLGMMRMEMMEITKLRLSFVARAMGLHDLYSYIQLTAMGVLVVIFHFKRPRLEPRVLPSMNNALRRKARSKVLFEKRWARAAVASFFVILSPLLYYDLYAAKPPRITRPTSILPGGDGLVRIKIDDVKDGKLHRYSHITSDGTKVRFFLINRYPGSNKIGVVYDACQICGATGYNQEGNDVVCLACNVRIFIPSIGKTGGCNPIPLDHEVQGDTMVISEAVLNRGARYFSELVEIKVKDPVTGKELINLKAPHRYDYKGRTYFFESERSLETFRNDPEKYSGEEPPRYFGARPEGE